MITKIAGVPTRMFINPFLCLEQRGNIHIPPPEDQPEWQQHYQQFKSRCLCPREDPTVYQWELEEMLKMADTSLCGLPHHLQIKLLEHDPVLTLERMVSFTRNVHAIEWNVRDDFTTAVITAHVDKLTELTQLIEKLATKQLLRVQLQSVQKQQSMSGQLSTNCFSCGKRRHFAHDCQNRKSCDPLNSTHCFTCGQSGHHTRDCMPLNSQRVAQPRL